MTVSVVFNDRRFAEADVEPALRAAARGEPPAAPKELHRDGGAWSHAFVGALKGTPLWPAVGQALAALMASGDDDEIRLATNLQGAHFVMSGDALLTEALRLGAGGPMGQLFTLFRGLAMDPASPWDARLRAFAFHPLVGRAALPVYLRHDLPWVVAHVDELIPRGAADLGRHFNLCGEALSRAEIDGVEAALGPVVAGWGSGCGQAFEAAMADLRARARL